MAMSYKKTDSGYLATTYLHIVGISRNITIRYKF